MLLSALSSLAAGPPGREHHSQVLSVDHAVIVEVGDHIGTAPGGEQDREIETIDHAVTVEIGGAVGLQTTAPVREEACKVLPVDDT